MREALARLADIGLVEAKPGVYTRITTLNRRDVEKTLAVLRSLDQLAIETAVPVMTEQDRPLMRQANRDFERAVAANDTDAALASDDRFHASRSRRRTTLLGGRNTIEHHDQLIDVCAGGDGRAAAEFSGQRWFARLTERLPPWRSGPETRANSCRTAAYSASTWWSAQT